ncbi:uncharacterized protein LOC111335346 [Stylophora pistillata]|uniref:uncharacterized protein LOC111335346 n=1 Tax=Stylophora pistillata TaxID=50429 RepID=UPI000C03B1FC|nr:uncharacterized protein LOC111335346 [Stylophora pistillata]
MAHSSELVITLLLSSLTIPVYSSSASCSTPMGMENGQIRDTQITASSEFLRNHAAVQGRLNFKAGGGKTGSWSANINNGYQWLQVDLGRYKVVTGIATQGRNAVPQWVTLYELQYSEDEVTFVYYKEPGQSSPKRFVGNRDQETVVYHKLSTPIQARFIRIRPKSWYGWISLRMELYGCLGCFTPLGMENGRIKDAQITASSDYSVQHAAKFGRLNFKARGKKQGGWSAGITANSWIQVDLTKYTVVKGIATQGRNGYSQWVTKYKLQYSDDGVNFHYYGESDQNPPKVFEGNKDTDSIVYHHLYPPIKARFIRLRPTEWSVHVSLRMELYGCLDPSAKLQCNRNNMTIHVPKTLLPGINRVHLRLLDTECKAEEDDIYYSLTTPLTGCKTTRKHTTTAVVYSNMVLKVPTASKKAMIRELKIQFSCVYSSHGVVSSVGWRAVNRKVIISEEGEGNFTLVLNMFPDKKFEIPYKEEDFPLFVAQKRLFLEVSVISDRRLSIIADRCYTTPTRERENAQKYEFISKGCANYPSVVYHPAPSINLQRFSLETAKFIGTDSFVFVHCHVIVCNATDPDSQCAKKCPSGNRGKRQVSDHEIDERYSLTQGPLLHVSAKKKEKESNGETSNEKNASDTTFVVGLVMICIACLAAMGTGLVVFKKLRDKRSAAEVFSGHEKEKHEH